MDAVLDYLAYFDIFGYNLSFRHNKFIKYRTYYGGILTIICTGFLMYAFVNLSRDCFNKTNPAVRESSYYEDFAILNAEKFFFSFYFTDNMFNNMPNPEKYVIFHGVITNYTNEIETKTVPFVKCNYPKHFYNTTLSKEKVDQKLSNFNNTYCLDLEGDFNLINSGTEIPRLSLSIFVIECKNTTIDGVDCKLILKFIIFI